MSVTSVGDVAGIIQCCLAVVAIVVDILLAVFAGQFVKNKKDKEAESNATDALNANASVTNGNNAEDQACTKLILDKKLRKQAQGVLKRLKKKYKNTYPNISAISIVIAFKKLYDGNESLVVQRLKGAKLEEYLDWNGDQLLSSTIITIKTDKETKLIDYLGSRKS